MKPDQDLAGLFLTQPVSLAAAFKHICHWLDVVLLGISEIGLLRRRPSLLLASECVVTELIANKTVNEHLKEGLRTWFGAQWKRH